MIKKMFYEDLLKWGKYGKPKAKEATINWSESVGNFVDFEYDNIKGKVEIVGYEPKGQFLYIRYENGEPFRIHTSSFQKCQLGGLLGKKTNKFKIEIGTHYKDEKRDIVITDRKYKKDNTGQNKKCYKYKCNKCGFECGEHYKNGELEKEYWAEENGLLRGNGCACCCNPSRILVQGINDIPTTDPWMIKFFQGGYDEAKNYTKGSNQNIFLVCPDCGRIKEKKMYINTLYTCKSIGCICGDGFSYGHKYMHNLLTQLNLDVEENKRFNWCKFPGYKDKNKVKIGEYDFIVNEYKLIIEVDGGWHRQDNKLSGKTKEHSKYLDDMKDLRANENGYKVVRISDEDSIKDNILKSELVNIFNLNNINWLKCEEFALNNRVKEACKLKHDSPELTTTQIGKIMNINNTTILDYLKKGTMLGWCEYDPVKEVSKVSSKNGKLSGKSIEVLKNGISQGIFESINELDRQSEEVFGIKLHNSAISRVCNGILKQHKGFIFRYL